MRNSAKEKGSIYMILVSWPVFVKLYSSFELVISVYISRLIIIPDSPFSGLVCYFIIFCVSFLFVLREGSENRRECH